MSAERLVLPLVPLRDIVVFPFVVIPLFVGREKSIRALEKSMSEQKSVFLAAQRHANTNDPKPSDIYETGTFANMLQILKLTDGTMKVLVEGMQRGRIIAFEENADYLEVEVVRIEENMQVTPELKALMRSIEGQFEQYGRPCNPCPPKPPWCAITSTGWSTCRGKRTRRRQDRYQKGAKSSG